MHGRHDPLNVKLATHGFHQYFTIKLNHKKFAIRGIYI
jgi:hypothetical protein